MKVMAKNEMLNANGGHTFYKCNICGSPALYKFQIESHCKSKHSIKTCYSTRSVGCPFC